MPATQTHEESSLIPLILTFQLYDTLYNIQAFLNADHVLLHNYPNAFACKICQIRIIPLHNP